MTDLWSDPVCLPPTPDVELTKIWTFRTFSTPMLSNLSFIYLELIKPKNTDLSAVILARYYSGALPVPVNWEESFSQASFLPRSLYRL